MILLYDSNILIDYLNGNENAKKELNLSQMHTRFISPISWIEVMTGAKKDQADDIKKFLNKFKIAKFNSAVCEKAVAARRELKLKLPDAIILATAEANSAILVTRDKMMAKTSQFVRIPY